MNLNDVKTKICLEMLRIEDVRKELSNYNNSIEAQYLIALFRPYEVEIKTCKLENPADDWIQLNLGWCYMYIYLDCVMYDFAPMGNTIVYTEDFEDFKKKVAGLTKEDLERYLWLYK